MTGFLNSVVLGLRSLATGAGVMALCMFCISIAAGVWGLFRLLALHDPSAKSRAAALAASNLPLYGWLVLFWQHTAIHARFMDRILVWTIVSGMALFALAVTRDNSPPLPR